MLAIICIWCSRSDYINSPTFEQRTQVLHLVEGPVQEACAHVYALGQSDPVQKGMGTTIAMLLALGEAAVMAHTGDSRVYVIRDHQAHQLTADHSLVWHMLKSGRLTREEAAHWPYSNVIARSVGTKSTVQEDILFVGCMAHDRFLLCSGGFHNCLKCEEELAQMSAHPKRSATVRVVEPTKAMRIRGHDFYGMLAQEPAMAVKLLRSFVLAMHQRLRTTNAELIEARGALAALSQEILVSPADTTATP